MVQDVREDQAHSNQSPVSNATNLSVRVHTVIFVVVTAEVDTDGHKSVLFAHLDQTKIEATQ